jgi:hypothetical protein
MDMLKMIADLDVAAASAARITAGHGTGDGAGRALVDPNVRLLIDPNVRMSVPEPPERLGQ